MQKTMNETIAFDSVTCLTSTSILSPMPMSTPVYRPAPPAPINPFQVTATPFKTTAAEFVPSYVANSMPNAILR